MRRALLCGLLVFSGVMAAPVPVAAAGPTVVLEADAFVDSGRPDLNTGGASRLETDVPGVESHLRFRVEGAGTRLVGATLRLHVTNGSPDGPSVHATTGTWSESTLSWRNRPAAGPALDDVARTTAGAWSEWDVTSVVDGDGLYGFVLVPGSTDGTDFAAKESGANVPQLVLELAPDPAPGDPPPPPPGDDPPPQPDPDELPPALGVISAVAGNGQSGFSGDGGPALSARTRSPRTTAAGPDGVVYFVDTDNHRVRKVERSGRITTIAGTGTAGYGGDGGTATSARLNTPHGIAVDAAGNVFVADPPNQRIRRIDTRGIITTVAGTGTRGYSGDGGPATSARINYPKGVEVGPDGALYIADNNNHRVRRVGSNGVITTVAGTGSRGFSGDGGPATSARFDEPRNVTFDAAGNMYVVDQNNNRIRRVTPGGIVTTFAGNGSANSSGDGGRATSAGLDLPRDVAVDRSGNVYVAQEDANRVRRIDRDGIITTFAGTGSSGDSGDGGPAASARLDRPRGVAYDPVTDRVLIADTGNHRLRAVR